MIDRGVRRRRQSRPERDPRQGCGRGHGPGIGGLALSPPLAGRQFALVVHGDTVGAESLRRALADWASDMHLMLAGSKSEVDGYIGYFGPYATGHDALDRDVAFQADVRNAALTLMEAVEAKRAGRLIEPGSRLKNPRPK